MKNELVVSLFLLPRFIGVASDDDAQAHVNQVQKMMITENTDSMSDTLLIKIGDKEFAATLLANPTTAQFKEMLPLTVNMTELNDNEKYFRLAKKLPTNESNPEAIKTGDLMLYGTSTFVLFYETFSTSYSYT